MANLRDELDNKQFNLRFELEQIIKNLKEYRHGNETIESIKIYIEEINKLLGR